MPQRRAVVSKESKEAATVAAVLPLEKGSLELEEACSESETVPLSSSASSSETRKSQYERHQLRLKHWNESPFAIGLTEPTWAMERDRPSPVSRGYGDSEVEPDDTGCLCFSAYVCPLLGAERLGNMAVLKSSHEWVEEVTEDEETGKKTTRRFKRPRLDIVVGPYWPMLCVTYGLILGVSGWTLRSGILTGGKPPMLILVWFICTLSLIIALACTAFRNPGIMFKHPEPPPQEENTWRWTEAAQTFRPRGAYYDRDTAVVVEAFDHTCPWTGTAIGSKNMLSFQMFVCLVFLCMILDIFILTGAFG